MRVLRGLVGSVLWILSGVLGLVGVLLCVTVILLPLGLPVLALARRLFRLSLTFFLPRAVRHPVQELKTSAKDAADSLGAGRLTSRRARRKARKKAGKKLGRTAAKAGRSARRTRKKVGRRARGVGR